jgi:hypothetical protein
LTAKGFDGLGRKYALKKLIFAGNPDAKIYAPGEPMNGRAIFENNLWNSVAFYDDQSKNSESFNFFGTNEKNNLADIYIRDDLILRRYISYFKSKFSKVAHTIDQSYYIKLNKVEDFNPDKNEYLTSLDMDQFIKNTPISTLPILTVKGETVFLSPKQSHLMIAIASGLPFKILEEKIGIKAKTAELYWTLIKAKTGFRDRLAIINAFHKANLSEIHHEFKQFKLEETNGRKEKQQSPVNH